MKYISKDIQTNNLSDLTSLNTKSQIVFTFRATEHIAFFEYASEKKRF